jgi:acyl-CoA synthetase (AMP-forming)/AMP-acid ligase II
MNQQIEIDDEPPANVNKIWWERDTLFVEYMSGQVWLYEGARITHYNVSTQEHTAAEIEAGLLKVDIAIQFENSIDNINIAIK